MPVIRYDTDDSVPPPLPPPRTESLVQVNKNLPTIPYSVSANDLDLVNRNTNNHNQVSATAAATLHHNNVDRPLPPLPTNSSLDIINEPVSTDEDQPDEDDVGDEANEISSNSDSDNERIDEEEVSDADSESNDDNMGDETIQNASPVDGMANRLNGSQEPSFDADATLPPSPTEKTMRTNGFASGAENNDR